MKAQLDTREATVGELQSKLFWTEFANNVLLKDDERQKKEIATLEQKLSQYKQAYEQVQKKNSGLVAKLQHCRERNRKLCKANQDLQKELLTQKDVEGQLRQENKDLQGKMHRFSDCFKKQKFCLLKQIRRLTRTSISTGVSFTLEDSKWIFAEATQLCATDSDSSTNHKACQLVFADSEQPLVSVPATMHQDCSTSFSNVSMMSNGESNLTIQHCVTHHCSQSVVSPDPLLELFLSKALFCSMPCFARNLSMNCVIPEVSEADTCAIEMSLTLVQEQMSAFQVLRKVQDVFADSMSLFPADNNPVETVIESDYDDQAPVVTADNGKCCNVPEIPTEHPTRTFSPIRSMVFWNSSYKPERSPKHSRTVLVITLHHQEHQAQHPLCKEVDHTKEDALFMAVM